MGAFLWIILPLFVAAGSALLAFYVMQARLEVAVARERESLAEARALVALNHKLTAEKVRAAEEEARRKAMDEFLADLRVEERHYQRESRSLFQRRKCLVLQERLFFRNIPLSKWVEHEMTLEEGADIADLASAVSVFTSSPLPAAQAATRLLR